MNPETCLNVLRLHSPYNEENSEEVITKKGEMNVNQFIFEM